MVLLAVSSLFYDEEIDLKVAFLLPAVTDLRAREYGGELYSRAAV